MTKKRTFYLKRRKNGQKRKQLIFIKKNKKSKIQKLKNLIFLKKQKNYISSKKTHKPLKNNEKKLDEPKKTFCEKYAKIEKTKKQKFYIFDFC